jgi:hypothetical protein
MIQWMMQGSLSAMSHDELRRRQVLYALVFKLQVVALVALTLLVSFSFLHFGAGVIVAYGSPCLIMLLTMLVGRSLVFGGRYNMGVMVTTTAIVLTLFFFMALWGARDTVIFVCIWPVMTSTLLLQPRAGFVVAGVISLFTAILSALELMSPEVFPFNPDQILYPPNWHQGASLEVIVSIAIDASVNIVVLFSVAFLSWVLSESLLDVIRDARATVEELQEISKRNERIATRLRAAVAQVESYVVQQQRGAAEASSAVGQIGASLRHLLEASRELASQSADVAANARKNLDQDSAIVAGIDALQDRAVKIDDVVQSIADIGNKSDILALNAALEGVKAGELGRGFTVVANQMQRLAEEVLTTLPSVSTHVSNIRRSTEELREATREGTSLTEKIADFTQQFSHFARRQEQGTEEVSTAVADIERVTQETVVSTRELLSAMGELMDLSSSLVVSEDRG